MGLEPKLIINIIGEFTMKLSDGEKIIIALLADIHKSLKIEGDSDIKRVMSAIYGGHLWGLKWDMTGLLHDYEADPDVVSQTCSILDMWDFIEFSFADLADGDKERVREANFGDDPKFSGFDANNEDHYGIARHLIDEMDRFSNFKGRNMNSHSSQVGVYLRMAAAFEPIRALTGTRPKVRMTADEIVSLFQAGYPKADVA
jgi:uncharacterized protein YfbU (UPF0304 family)